MSEEMQQESVDIASVALEKYNIEKDIAAQIKKEFDRRHGPTWHVVVGKNFGSYVTHGMSLVPSFFSFSLSSTKHARERVLGKGLHDLRLFLLCRLKNIHLSVFFAYLIPRNQTLHLLLRRHPCHPHLEIMNSLRTSSYLELGLEIWTSALQTFLG